MNIVRVAIDGPVGAGKSTIAKECAKRLGYIYIDTGALYRAVGLYCARLGADVGNEDEVRAALDGLTVEIKLETNGQRVCVNGTDVTDEIRTPEVSMLASKVSAIPCVRVFLLGLQRSFATEHSVIMDGRDIGTVILPDAEVKIFLTASAEERAKRRFDELVAKGTDVSYDDVLKDLNERDYNDSHRAQAPLKKAEDATEADTGGMTLEDSIELILGIIRKNTISQSGRNGNNNV